MAGALRDHEAESKADQRVEQRCRHTARERHFCIADLSESNVREEVGQTVSNAQDNDSQKEGSQLGHVLQHGDDGHDLAGQPPDPQQSSIQTQIDEDLTKFRVLAGTGCPFCASSLLQQRKAKAPLKASTISTPDIGT